MKLLDHMATLLLVLGGTSVLFSTMDATIYIRTNSVRGLFLLHALPSIYYFVDFLNGGHSYSCKVVPHCSFDFAFL